MDESKIQNDDDKQASSINIGYDSANALNNSPTENLYEENYIQNENHNHPPELDNNKELNNDRIDKEGSPDDEDAEILSGSDDNDSSEEDSMESSDGGSDDDEHDANELNGTNDDGQPLSAYEIRRLERIRRNQDYLAKLGLDDQKEQQQQTKSLQKVKKNDARPVAPTREIISRRTKAKPISYTEPRIRAIYIENHDTTLTEDHGTTPTDNALNGDADVNTELFADPLAMAIQEETNNILDSELFNTAFDADNVDILVASSHLDNLDFGSDHQQHQNKPKRRQSERMDLSVFKEFKRLNAHKNHIIKEAEKLVRAAEKEVRIWRMKWERWNLKWEKEERQRQREEMLREKERRRQIAAERQVKELEAFRRRIEYEIEMFGSTINQLLETVDARMPELYAAVNEYDDEFRRLHNKSMKEQQIMEYEYRMKASDYIESYPKALKKAVTLLNSILLARSPKFKSETRRSSKNNGTEESTDAKSKRVVKKRNSYGSKPETNDSLFQESEPILQTLSSQNRLESFRENKRFTKENIDALVSPVFAAKIDRSWFFKNSLDFDPLYYVPQIGDVILYYIAGHKAFLESYPEMQERTANCSSRIPLWERAKHDLRVVASGDESEESSSQKQWWTHEWQREVEEGDLGYYPLLCRVESTYTEFPEDPVKAAPKDSTEGIIVTKMHRTSRDPALFKLRLVVCLRPLSSVVPPLVHGDIIEPSTLSPPPLFSVAIFPSKHDPFIIPFAWAYSIRHSLKCNQIVFSKDSIDSECRIDGFSHLSDSRYGSFSLDDKLPLIQSILSRIKSAQTVTFGLQREIGCLQNTLEMECRTIIDLFNNLLRSNESSVKGALPTTQDIEVQLIDLILSSLPIWQAVGLLRTAYERKLNNASPWNLILLENDFPSPWQIGIHSFYVEQSLRSKLDVIVTDAMKEDEAEIFVDPVDERDAPEYYSVVPFGMCLWQISQRLKSETRSSKNGGTYRSIDSLLADVDLLLENCSKYNDPESEIVRMATELVDRLRKKIVKKFNDYNLELQEARKVDADRRMLVFYQRDDRSTSFTNVSTRQDSEEQNTIIHPFNDTVIRTWLEQVTEIGPFSVSSENGVIGEKLDASQLSWIPQPGDTILYSTVLHRKFLEGHHPSLCQNQCMVFVPPENNKPKSDIDCNRNNGFEWVSGEVIRTRASFPSAVNELNDENVHTFVSSSPLMTLGVKFENNDDLVEIHWRPCIFSFDPKPENGICPSCGVSCSTSFLRLSISNEAVVDTNPTSSIPEDEIESINRCFSLLKQRCVDRLPIAVADNRITKASLKKDCPIPPIQLSDLSSYDTLAEKQLGDTLGTNDTEDSYPGLQSLIQIGFLPRWINENGSIDIECLHLCETLLPSTKLCLDFIRLRLLRKFYRSKKALENDVMEAYLSTVIMTLASSARRKQDPISVKRLIKLVVSRQATGETKDTDVQSELFLEENNLAHIIRQIRDLYAAALVSISNTRQAEFVFGLQGVEFPQAYQESEHEFDPIRVEAREKIGDLLNAVGLDRCLNRFGKKNRESATDKGYVDLRIFCNGRTTSFKRDSVVAVQTHAFATVNNKDLRVKIVCNDRVLTRNLTKDEADAAQLSESMYQTSGKVPVSTIPFYAWDCDGNERLVKLLFARPNRLGPCARCSLAKQSMLTCRVHLGHSNPDYDWFSSLGGTGGVEGLLHTLRTGTLYKANTSATIGEAVPETDSADSAPFSYPQNQDLITDNNIISVDNTASLSISEPLPSTEVLPVEDITQTGSLTKVSTSDQQQPESNVEDSNEDPTDIFEQAKHVFDLAEQVHEDARKYYEAPARLSEDFVDGFPVDDDDGHYVYCIICGLIGDLLCCDGCPNVVHAECIGLNKIPEGDWFCEECIVKKRQKPKIGLDNTNEDSSHSSNLDRSDRLPFGRMEFDDSRIEDLNTWLDELREKRGFVKFKFDRIDDSMHDRVSIVEHEEPISYKEDVPQATETSPMKRKRGRPRKFPLPENLDVSMSSIATANKRNRKRRRDENSDSDDDTPLLGLSKKVRLKLERAHEDEIFETESGVCKDDSDVLSVESLSSIQLSVFRPRLYSHPTRTFDSEYVGVDQAQVIEVIVPSMQTIESSKETKQARRRRSTPNPYQLSRRLRTSRGQRK